MKRESLKLFPPLSVKRVKLHVKRPPVMRESDHTVRQLVDKAHELMAASDRKQLAEHMLLLTNRLEWLAKGYGHWGDNTPQAGYFK